MGQDDSSSGLALGLTIGVLAGVAIGLLLAPKPGSETRSLVKDAIATGIERLREIQAGQETQAG